MRSGIAFVLAFTAMAAAAPLAPGAPRSDSREPAAGAAVAHAERGAEARPIPIAEVPLPIHRRAARHLEAMRQTTDSVWVEARLGSLATPMYRLGVGGVAHYEVPVQGPGGEPLGYILLSTAEHAAPVVISARGGLPASEQLVAMAAERGDTVARIWVLGANTYVAEDERGERVAQLGASPPRLEGLDLATLDLPAEARAVHAGPGAGGAPELVVPPAVRAVRHGEWGSWDELRAALADPRSVLAEIARRNAASSWVAERQIEALPARLEPMEVQRVPLLARGDAEIELEGPGAAYVTAEREGGTGGDAWVSLRVTGRPREISDFTLSIRYAGGERELVGFAIPAPLALPKPLAIAQAFPTCSRVALRTHNGRYVSVLQGGVRRVDARADRVGPWETFEVQREADGRISLRTSSMGAYIEPLRSKEGEPAGGGGLTADIGSRSAAHLLRPVPSDGGTFALQTESGHFLVAEGGGGGDMNANRRRISAWERFQVVCNPPAPQVLFADSKDEPTAWRMQRKYLQLKGREAPNTSVCASGCGSTAWAMLIGYADNAAAERVPRWAAFPRLYLQSGGRGKLAADAVAPEWQDRGIQNITLEIRAALGDFGSGCEVVSGQRFTMPHIMAQANRYFWGRVPAYVTADYDGAYISTAAGESKLRDVLERQRKPAPIGIDYHYPIAWGLRRVTPQRWDPARRAWVDPGAAAWFMDVNYGWGESHSHSVPIHTWFVGDLITAPYSRVDEIARTCTIRAKGGGPSGRLDHDYKCTTHFRNNERFVAFEVAQRLIERDVLPMARGMRNKVCMLDATDLQCAPCSTTDRLIVRMDLVAAHRTACPANTVNELR